MTNDSTPQPSADVAKMCDNFAARLIEHCQSVRIFITKESDDGNADTRCYSAGEGNFSAQLGQVREWLIMQEELSRQRIRNSFRPNDDDDGEDSSKPQ